MQGQEVRQEGNWMCRFPQTAEMTSPRTGQPLLSSEKRASTFHRKLLKTRVGGCLLCLCWGWCFCPPRIGVTFMNLKILEQCAINVTNIILGYAMKS